MLCIYLLCPCGLMCHSQRLSLVIFLDDLSIDLSGMLQPLQLFMFLFFFFKFYLNSSQLTYSEILVSGVKFSDLSFTYNTQCSTQPVTHLAHPPPTSPPSTLSLFSMVFTFPSLFLPFPCVHMFYFLTLT